MCIVIDICSFTCVFDRKNSKHDDFSHVRNWLYHGDGFIVYGGSKYKSELKKLTKFLQYLTELQKIRKITNIIDDAVDKEQEKVEKIIDTDCNDTHIIGIIRASGCRLICSCDKKADIHFKNKELYETGKVPHIYRNKSHRHLLSKNNIVKISNLT